MEIIDSHEFNIFEVKKHTKENELITVITYLLHKHHIFSNLKIRMETFLKFISAVQSGYQNVTYHNKTHGADLAATSYFYMMKGGFYN
jgi:hypothetical protein